MTDTIATQNLAKTKKIYEIARHLAISQIFSKMAGQNKKDLAILAERWPFWRRSGHFGGAPSKTSPAPTEKCSKSGQIREISGSISGVLYPENPPPCAQNRPKPRGGVSGFPDSEISKIGPQNRKNAFRNREKHDFFARLRRDLASKPLQKPRKTRFFARLRRDLVPNPFTNYQQLTV